MMKKILVLSDNELLNQLYLINLQIYIGANVELSIDAKNAEDALLNLDLFDLIISVAMMDDYEIGIKCYEQLKKLNLKIPLIIIGAPSKDLNNVTIIQSSYNLQSLLRSVASELGVTARKMMEADVPKFYPIAMNYLSYIKKAPCMLYLQFKIFNDQNEYVLCLNKEENITSLISKLQREGVLHLYVQSQDRLIVVNKISSVLTQIIRDTAIEKPIEAKASAILAGFNFAASQMIDHEEVVQEIVAVAESCVKAMDAVLNDINGIKELMQLLMSNPQGYIYTHSMLTAYAAKHILKNVSWGAESHIERINFMVFFHDIYLVPLYIKYPEATSEEDLLFGNELSNEEKEVILNHARLAGEQVSKFKKCPSGIDLLIKQHHGMGGGIGFATEFNDNVSPLSKVFIIAEAFSEICLKHRSQNEKLKINLGEVLASLYDKYNKHTYKKIIEPLAKIRI